MANEKATMTINCDLKEEGLEMAVFSLAQTYQIWPQIVLSGYVQLSWAAIWGKHIFYNIENQFEGKKTWGYYRSRFDRYLTEISLSKRSNRQYS
ncbi:hypothetical protein N8B96_13930 (plasmid) [Enterococcus faecium]